MRADWAHKQPMFYYNDTIPTHETDKFHCSISLYSELMGTFGKLPRSWVTEVNCVSRIWRRGMVWWSLRNQLITVAQLALGPRNCQIQGNSESQISRDTDTLTWPYAHGMKTHDNSIWIWGCWECINVLKLSCLTHYLVNIQNFLKWEEVFEILPLPPKFFN